MVVPVGQRYSPQTPHLGDTPFPLAPLPQIGQLRPGAARRDEENRQNRRGNKTKKSQVDSGFLPACLPGFWSFV